MTLKTIKLQKYLAQAGVASRRKAEQLIAEDRVTVNNQPAHIGQRVDPTHDAVKIDRKLLKPITELVYFLVNKPVGYISSTNDELGRKTVLNLIPEQKNRIYPVGRLDQDSSGLMLLTNDGALAQKMTHPSYQTRKTYQVLVQGRPSTKALDHLKRGVKLKEGYTSPAEVDIIGHPEGNTWLEITIHEGRNRQIRRMMERVGYEILELVRLQMGPFSLDRLEDQPFIELTTAEVAQLTR
jgi:23S rRNA pseudouridine2605 synthase